MNYRIIKDQTESMYKFKIEREIPLMVNNAPVYRDGKAILLWQQAPCTHNWTKLKGARKELDLLISSPQVVYETSDGRTP